MSARWTMVVVTAFLTSCGGGEGSRQEPFGEIRIGLVTKPSDPPDFTYGFAVFAKSTSGLELGADECKRRTSNFLPESSYQDAGDSGILVDGPNGSFVLHNEGVGFYASVAELASLWEADATFSAEVQGGADVDPFTAQITTPGDLILANPTPSAGPIDIDVSEDFPIAWISSGSSAPVFIYLSDGESTLFCSFVDDGSAVIPAGDLQGSGSASLIISKRTLTTLEIDFGTIFLDGTREYWLGANLVD